MLSSESVRPYPSPLKTWRFWLAMALCAVLYLPTLLWALGLDQNIFAEIGSLILKGQKPYVNAWDVKPPNVYYTYALFEWIFGQNDFAIRVSDYVFTLFACAAIYLGVHRRLRLRSVSGWLARWAPFVAALLMVLTLLSLGLSDTAQTESYALGFILLAAYLAVSTNPARVLAAGAMIGIATFYKTTNALFLAPLLIEIGVVRMLHGRRVRSSVYLVVGFVVVCVLELGALRLTGALDAYLRIAASVVQHHTEEPGNVSFASLLRALWVSADIWAVMGALGVSMALLLEDRTMLKILRLPILYLAFGLLAVYVQHKGWGYHYVITHPGLLSMSAIGGLYLLDLLRHRSRILAYAAVALLVAATLIATPSARRRLHYVTDSFKDRGTYVASLGAKQSLYYPVCTDSLVAYLKRTTKPSDSVFIFGEEPGAYWRSDRAPANRYIYSLLFTSGVMDSKELRSIGYDLALKKPAVIVIERYDTTSFREKPETSESILWTDPDFAYLSYLLLTEYQTPDTVCDKFFAYRRR